MSLFAAFQKVDYFIVGGLSVVLMIALGTKSKPLSATLIAAIAFMILVAPPSKFITAHDPKTRVLPHAVLSAKKGPIDGDMLVKILMGAGAAAACLLLLLPATKKAQSAKATKENVLAAPGAQGIMRKEPDAWLASFNSARGNASQGAYEMAFRALETALAAGFDDPDRMRSDEWLAKLREKDERRFDKIAYKAEKNQARG